MPKFDVGLFFGWFLFYCGPEVNLKDSFSLKHVPGRDVGQRSCIWSKDLPLSSAERIHPALERNHVSLEACASSQPAAPAAPLSFLFWTQLGMRSCIFHAGGGLWLGCSR